MGEKKGWTAVASASWLIKLDGAIPLRLKQNGFRLMFQLHLSGSGFLEHCVKKASEAGFGQQERVLLSFTNYIHRWEIGGKENL